MGTDFRIGETDAFTFGPVRKYRPEELGLPPDPPRGPRAYGVRGGTR